MAVFQLGPIIRNRREELGLSQEDLADGICSVPTLSRIENGERMPTKNHFEMLMQRLGYSAMSLDFSTDKRDFRIHELKFRIRQCYMEERILEARFCLTEFEKMHDRSTTSVDKQFMALFRVLLYEEQYTNAEKLEQLETALRWSCPKYDKGHMPLVLSYEEIVLLNNIAICYDCLGMREKTISILTKLKEYYERNVVNSEESLRTQPMVLYNLSKYLGLNGQYDVCIEVCDIGIRIARSTGRCSALGKTLYNRAWALLRRDQIGDRSAAELSLRQARDFMYIMGDRQEGDYYAQFWEEQFGAESLL